MWLLVAACRPPEPEPMDAVAPAATDPDPRFEALVDWTQEQLTAWGTPGAALVVVEDGEISRVGTFGVRELGRPDPITARTRFRFGSISKMITGSIVAQLAADGVLDVDAPASDWIGDLALKAPRSFDELTTLQLVSHASGLQTGDLPRACETDPAALSSELAALTPEWELWTEPGVLYNYSNQGYGLAGLVAERASGRPFAELQAEAFDAIGMPTATVDWTLADEGEHVTGHTTNDDGELELHGLEERACVATYPSGGVMGTILDLGALGAALVGGGEGWVTADAWERMTLTGWARDVDDGYGYGLQSGDWGGVPTLSHGGAVDGMTAILWAVPSEGLAIGVLVNSSDPLVLPPVSANRATVKIARHALDVYLETDLEDIPSSVRPVDEWERFAGVYVSAFDLGEVVVTFDGTSLSYRADALELDVVTEPLSRNTFQWQVPGTARSWDAISFLDGEDGEVEWLVSGAGIARRVTESGAAPAR